MQLRPGARIWIPCEVKPGPFSDERMVRVDTRAGEWLGFVDVALLRDRDVQEGRTSVLATVEVVSEGTFTARLPGHSVRSLLFEGSVERVAPSTSFEGVPS
jgi:hypothetical protein